MGRPTGSLSAKPHRARYGQLFAFWLNGYSSHRLQPGFQGCCFMHPPGRSLWPGNPFASNEVPLPSHPAGTGVSGPPSRGPHGHSDAPHMMSQRWLRHIYSEDIELRYIHTKIQEAPVNDSVAPSETYHRPRRPTCSACPSLTWRALRSSPCGRCYGGRAGARGPPTSPVRCDRASPQGAPRTIAHLRRSSPERGDEARVVRGLAVSPHATEAH